jgi:hypothetical protein
VITIAAMLGVLVTYAQKAEPNSQRAESTKTNQSGADQSRSNSQQKGIIRGRVTTDDGKPISNVSVSITPSFGIPIREAVTDNDGNFVSDELPLGNYRVTARVPAYVQTSQPPPERPSGLYKIGDTVNLTFAKGGVVTGKVMEATGDPIVSAQVSIILIRDKDNKQLSGGWIRNTQTDDQGTYRVYGLPAGTYLVRAGGPDRNSGSGPVNPYNNDAPTYYPAASRSTASEVSLQLGEEVAGIDIRYRGIQGRVIGGSIAELPTVDSRINSVSLNLIRVSTREGVSSAFIELRGESRSFTFIGLDDGEYEITAMTNYTGKGPSISFAASRKLSVNGADVTAVELKLVALGSISGSIVFEAARPEYRCDNRQSRVEEIVVSASRDNSQPVDERSETTYPSGPGGNALTSTGEFAINNARAGRYRVSLQLPDAGWFLKSVTFPFVGAPARASTIRPALLSDALQGIINLRSGELLAGVSVLVGQNASGLRGRVTLSTEDAPLPKGLRIDLVPAEREQSENLLRYYEGSPNSAGEFLFKNLSPGKYWITTRVVPPSDPTTLPILPLAFDTVTRAKLRKEAEAANNSIDLKPCQRVSDFVLKLKATP